MIRLLLTLSFLMSLLGAKENIDKKISKTSHQLHSYSKNYNQVNKKMAQNAKAILEQRKELKKQNEYLKILKAELAKKSFDYDANKKQLSSLSKLQKNLKNKQNKIEEKLVFLIAQSVTLSIMLEEKNTVNTESLIEFEVLTTMLKDSKEKVSKLNKKFFVNANDIDNLNSRSHILDKSIKNIDNKRKNLLKVKLLNKKALKKLQRDKASYKKELKALITRQNSLKQTLSKLNIVKIDILKKEKEAKERKEAFKRQKVRLDENLPKVKKHGTSYQSVKTRKYKGPKTIAPLDSYKITKKYGTYVDPIYGIKIFNESISLKPKRANARVKTVFNGKVIYADKTAVLNNIVIVEHKGGLHTIYANLSQISNIKKGQKIKKGYTIGRVNKELIFEVTKKSYHINPIRLFQK